MLTAILACQQAAMAQSTIFNVPTTDTVAPKKGYFEFDYLLQAPKPEDSGRVQVFAPRIVVGVAPNLEVGANVFNYDYGSATLSYFQPNIKYKFASNDSKGLAAAAGPHLVYTDQPSHGSGQLRAGVCELQQEGEYGRLRATYHF